MQNSKTGTGYSSNFASAANANSSILTPTLNRLATAPQGYGQSTIDKMKTGAVQSAGGSAAGEIGSAALRASRTNNAGSITPSAVAANRDAVGTVSDASLGVDAQNAQLQEQQRQTGLRGLEGLYNTNSGDQLNALGLSTSALQAKNQADSETWNHWLGLGTLGLSKLGGGG